MGRWEVGITGTNRMKSVRTGDKSKNQRKNTIELRNTLKSV